MREILFRAKRRNGEWREGSLMFYPDVNRAYMSSGEFKSIGGIVEVDKNTIGQYTGLKDINGKKIFEGDIMSFVDSDGETIYVSVVFDAGAFLINENGEIISETLASFLDLGFCIAGNIYDNPDLVKEGVDKC